MSEPDRNIIPLQSGPTEVDTEAQAGERHRSLVDLLGSKSHCAVIVGRSAADSELGDVSRELLEKHAEIDELRAAVGQEVFRCFDRSGANHKIKLSDILTPKSINERNKLESETTLIVHRLNRLNDGFRMRVRSALMHETGETINDGDIDTCIKQGFSEGQHQDIQKALSLLERAI